jgi:hypothetical protein
MIMGIGIAHRESKPAERWLAQTKEMIMSKFVYSALAAAVLIAGVTPVAAKEARVDGQNGGSEYKSASTAAARAFWERMNDK